MIATCPACGKRYRIPDDAVPPEGRSVKCSACSHSWTAFPAPVAAPDPPPSLAAASPHGPDPIPPVRFIPVAAPRRSAAWRWLLPAAFVALVLASLAVVEFAPASTFTPPRLGLPALDLAALDLAGLDLPAIDLPPLDLTRIPFIGERVDALVHPITAPATPLRIAVTGERRRLATGGVLLLVTGRITNPTARPQTVTAIDARLVDPEGHVAYRWRIAPPVAVLPPRNSVGFDSTAANYPENARRLDLGFIPG